MVASGSSAAATVLPRISTLKLRSLAPALWTVRICVETCPVRRSALRDEGVIPSTGGPRVVALATLADNPSTLGMALVNLLLNRSVQQTVKETGLLPVHYDGPRWPFYVGWGTPLVTERRIRALLDALAETS